MDLMDLLVVDNGFNGLVASLIQSFGANLIKFGASGHIFVGIFCTSIFCTYVFVGFLFLLFVWCNFVGFLGNFIGFIGILGELDGINELNSVRDGLGAVSNGISGV